MLNRRSARFLGCDRRLLGLPVNISGLCELFADGVDLKNEAAVALHRNIRHQFIRRNIISGQGVQSVDLRWSKENHMLMREFQLV